MATLTAYGSSGSGYLQSFSASSYSDARTGDGTWTTYTNQSVVYVGQYCSTAVSYTNWNMYDDWDTSGITTANYVESAEASYYWYEDHDTTTFTVRIYSKDWGTSLTAADWFWDFGWPEGLALLADLDSSDFSGGYTALDSTATFAGYVNTSGETRVGVISSRAIGGNTPTGYEYMEFRGAGYTGTTRDPKLVCVYYTAISYSVSAIPLTASAAKILAPTVTAVSPSSASFIKAAPRIW